MDWATEWYIQAMMAAGFAVGIGAWILLALEFFSNKRRRRTWTEVEPDEQWGNRIADRYGDLATCDPRNPAFVVWADGEYDALFKKPTTEQGLDEKHRTIVGWAFIALDWLANPPSGKPQLSPAEAAWFYRQLLSSFWRATSNHQQ